MRNLKINTKISDDATSLFFILIKQTMSFDVIKVISDFSVSTISMSLLDYILYNKTMN